MAIKVSLEIDGSTYTYRYEVGEETHNQSGKISASKLEAITQAMHIMTKSCAYEFKIFEEQLVIKVAAENILKEIKALNEAPK